MHGAVSLKFSACRVPHVSRFSKRGNPRSLALFPSLLPTSILFAMQNVKATGKGMKKGPVPPRLFFLLARKSPTAVIFRRGPSDWVQLIRWNTQTDDFEPGQWFHGRVYEHRCDLSPNGELL